MAPIPGDKMAPDKIHRNGENINGRVAATDRLGATFVSDNEAHFRVWAPHRQTVAVEVRTRGGASRHGLERCLDGYFSGNVSGIEPGTLYQFVLDDQEAHPDPASRYQPEGVHGLSQIVASDGFAWTDQAWKGVPKRELIIYELHVGALTEQGTFRAAMDRLAELVALGVTAVELMPVAQSPGRWNWGYDGVDLFAVRNTYGAPDDFKALVNHCHALGLAVILDVVYNHVGPEGNYLARYGPYFSRTHRTPWGEAFNFDEWQCEHVRRFVVENAIYWLDEYHLDGLRLDAVHFMRDDSRFTILDEIRGAVSDYANAVERPLHLIAESNVYDRDLLAEVNGRAAYDAIWCDCLMHSIYSHALPDLQLSHRRYQGASDLAEALHHGYLYTGLAPVRMSARQCQPSRGGEARTSDVESFVMGLQTHDAVGNHPHGKRLHQLTSKAFQKAAVGLTMLYPGIPILFMGEESAAESPFPFFVDFEDDRLRTAVDQGRTREYPQHVWGNVMSPSRREAFYAAKCPAGNEGDADMRAWYRELIRLRKEGLVEGWLAAAPMTSEYDPERNIFSLRFEHGNGDAVLVQARLIPSQVQDVPPVMVPQEGALLLSSEPNPEAGDGWLLLQHNHVVISRSASRTTSAACS